MAVNESLDIVLVAFGFPPGFGPGVARPLAWANHLAGRGHRVRVVTALADVQAGGGVMREPSPTDVDPRIEVIALPGGFVDRLANVASRYRLRRLFDTVLTAEAGWGIAVTAWLCKHVTPRTVVVSTYTPSAALVGTLAARARAQFVWIADYRDPWVLRDNPMPTPLHLRAATAVDRRIHQKADGVVYTSWIDKENARAAYPGVRASLVIRNGVDGEAFSQAGELRPEPVILFAGNLYAAPENPQGRLDALERLYWRTIPYDYSTYSLVPLFRAVARARRATHRNIRVKIVGTVTKCTVQRALTLANEDPAAAWAEVGGVVDKNTVARIGRAAAALYLPVAGRKDHRPSGWVPQKLFEMVAGDRPIITTALRGEASSLLGSSGVFRLTGGDDDSLAVCQALDHVPARVAGKRLFKRVSQARQLESFALRLLRQERKSGARG